MSWQAVKAVLKNSKQVGTVKLVLVCIAEHYSEETKTSWPGVELLAGYCNVSRQSIFNALAKLKAAGELEISYKSGPNGVNVYEILCLGDSEQSSQLDSKAGLTVKPALLRQSSQLYGSVKPALPEPSVTIIEPGTTTPRAEKTEKHEQHKEMALAVISLLNWQNVYLTEAAIEELNLLTQWLFEAGATVPDLEHFKHNYWWGRTPPSSGQIKKYWTPAMAQKPNGGNNTNGQTNGTYRKQNSLPHTYATGTDPDRIPTVNPFLS